MSENSNNSENSSNEENFFEFDIDFDEPAGTETEKSKKKEKHFSETRIRELNNQLKTVLFGWVYRLLSKSNPYKNIATEEDLRALMKTRIEEKVEDINIEKNEKAKPNQLDEVTGTDGPLEWFLKEIKNYCILAKCNEKEIKKYVRENVMNAVDEYDIMEFQNALGREGKTIIKIRAGTRGRVLKKKLNIDLTVEMDAKKYYTN
jgi:hypothetical protein